MPNQGMHPPAARDTAAGDAPTVRRCKRRAGPDLGGRRDVDTMQVEYRGAGVFLANGDRQANHESTGVLGVAGAQTIVRILNRIKLTLEDKMGTGICGIGTGCAGGGGVCGIGTGCAGGGGVCGIGTGCAGGGGVCGIGTGCAGGRD